MAQFMGDNRLEVVLVRADPARAGTEVPIPATDQGDQAAGFGRAEYALRRAAQRASVTHLKLDARGGGIPADFNERDAEGTEGHVQVVDRVVDPRLYRTRRGTLESVHGYEVDARVDLAEHHVVGG